jgi:signal transduction histidine kinase
VDGVLRSADAWYIADTARTTIFRTVTSTQEFAPGIGLPGMALSTGRPIWIEHLTGDINFPRLRFAERCGLKCGVAFPVLSGNEVLAVVEFYDTEPRTPDAALLDLMTQAGVQLGRAIERQNAQERLQAQAVELAAARDEAKAADKAKSAFLANMSHELRTPLNAIIGFSDVMIEGLYGPLSAKYSEYMHDIRNSGIHLKDILNDILDLSKIDAGAMSLNSEAVSLTEIAEACRRIIAPLAQKAGVGLSFEIPGRPAALPAGPDAIQANIDQHPVQCREIHTGEWHSHRERCVGRAGLRHQRRRHRHRHDPGRYRAGVASIQPGGQLAQPPL